jgi:hypothetical protein
MKSANKLLLLMVLFSTAVFADSWQWQVGPNISFAFPNKHFANVTTTGEGLGAKITYNLKQHPWINPRIDFVYLSYGEKRSSAGVDNGYGLLIETRNESFQLSAGLHIAKPEGRLRYYLAPLGGIFNYRAVTTVPELYYYYGYPVMNTHDSQYKWGARLQCGFLFDIGLGPLIDLGFTYQRIFNTETSINDQVIHSDAEDFMVTIGLMFFSGKTVSKEWE